jgi:predicted kinase
MVAEAQVIVITGIQGAGKSTVGRLLAARFERAAFIEADDLQRMIVAGGHWVTEPGEPTGEPAAQLRLRLRNACILARSFVGSGFTVILDDIIIGERLGQLKEDLSGMPFQTVVLAPRPDVVVERDAARHKTVGADWAAYLDAELRKTMSGVGIWIDNSEQTPDETVGEITTRLDYAGLLESDG